MYNRAQMKLVAKTRLAKGGRWVAVLVCLIAALLGGGVSVNTPSLEFKNQTSVTPSFGSETMLEDTLPYILGFVASVMTIVFVIALAYSIFVANIVKVGAYGWFMRYAREELPPVQHVFLGFRIYGKALVTMLLHDLFILLWSLLFIIPGIIKSLGYYLVPYILYENPKLSPKEALALSEKMMDGWKTHAFKLELSFIGWRLLSALTLGILDVLYVNPYYQTTHALFYDMVRYDALYVRRVITHEDLDITPPQAEETPSEAPLTPDDTISQMTTEEPDSPVSREIHAPETTDTEME